MFTNSLRAIFSNRHGTELPTIDRNLRLQTLHSFKTCIYTCHNKVICWETAFAVIRFQFFVSFSFLSRSWVDWSLVGLLRARTAHNFSHRSARVSGNEYYFRLKFTDDDDSHYKNNIINGKCLLKHVIIILSPGVLIILLW